MKTFKHIIYTRFDSHSATQYDKEWLKYRIEIFKKYTLKSLLNQTNKNFVLWIRYHEDFRSDVEELNDYLKTLDLKCFFSYYDNYTDKEIESLNEYVKDADLVLETRIDSDDMYHCSVVDEIQKSILEKDKIFIYMDGYLYQENTNQLWEYKGSGAPFYTCTYPFDVYIDASKKKNYYPFLPDVSQSKNREILSNDKFIVVVHDKNMSRYVFDYVKEANLQSGSMFKAKIEIKPIVNILKEFGFKTRENI